MNSHTRGPSRVMQICLLKYMSSAAASIYDLIGEDKKWPEANRMAIQQFQASFTLSSFSLHCCNQNLS